MKKLNPNKEFGLTKKDIHILVSLVKDLRDLGKEDVKKLFPHFYYELPKCENDKPISMRVDELYVRLKLIKKCMD